MTITTSQRALMIPGTCTRCQAYSALDRNSAGECTDCHNLSCQERRALMADRREAKRAEGVAYWHGRGIRVGQRVKTSVVSMLWSTSQEISGIAKVGAVGAYVSSRFQKGYLSPERWQAV